MQSWRKRWVVLRGDRLSVYKDQKEYKIQKQVLLADLTAVALLKDAKKPNVFGCFSPSRNYHFQADDAKAAQEWVDLIKETAVLENDSELRMAEQINRGIVDKSNDSSDNNRLWSSSPEPIHNTAAMGVRSMNTGALSSQTLDYSGAELVSCSSVSDIGRLSQLSLCQPEQHVNPPQPISEEPAAPEPGVLRNLSGFSADDDSKTIWHGYLYVLKSKSGLKQWKKFWVVLRTKNLAFYKDDDEYRAIRLVSLDDIIDAVELDPLSRSKKHCMEIITGAKSFKLCASDEESLTRWLGAFKSTLAKRRPLVETGNANTPAANTAQAQAAQASKA